MAATTTIQSQVVRPFTSRFSVNDNSDVQLIGNTLETCPASTACTQAQSGANTTAENNNFNMIYVDVDGDPTTFNSSTATFTLPSGATVVWAGLYWGGFMTAGAGGAAPITRAARGTVQFATPLSGYAAITGSVDVTADSSYAGFADVTSLVQAGGSGNYTVANVQSATGANLYAGWSLIIIYRSPSSPTRNITVFDGYGRVTTGTNAVIPVSGFKTPLAGAVNTQVGVVAYEGDLGLTGDFLELNASKLTDALNPNNNFFNSRITRLGAYISAKNPNYQNQLAVDIKLVDASGTLANGATTATLTASTTGDTYYPSAFVFETGLYAPDLAGQIIKTVTPVHGAPVRPGDTLQYNVTVQNIGQDGAANTVFVDTIPAGTTYAPGSLSITAGANNGAKTDATGDDQGEFDAAGNRVMFRLGTGATATAGGLMAMNQSTTVSFKVKTLPTDGPGFVVANQAIVTFTGQTLGTAYTEKSDSSTGGHNLPTKIIITVPDLTITKSHGGAAFVEGGTGTYTITVTNSGNTPTSGTITVVDTVPAGLTPTAATGTGWTCAVVAQVATCTRADAFAGGAALPAVSISVNVAPSAPASVTNAATVSGGGEANTTNDRATDVTPITAEPDLSVSKTHTGTFTVGGVGVYTLVVTNGGSAASGVITVVDTLPAGLTFASDSGTGWTCAAAAQVVTCTNAGPLAVGAHSTLLLRANIGPTAFPSVTNTAHVATAGDRDPAGKASTDGPTAVGGAPDLSLTKTHTGTFTVGTPARYTLLVTNLGSAATSGTITVVDTLPAGLTFASDSATAWTCAAVAQVVTCTSATAIAPTASSGLALVLTVGAGAVPAVTNTAHVATVGDFNAANNVATDGPTGVAGVVDVGVTLAGAGPFTVGQVGHYVATVTNVGSAVTTGSLVVTDTLPAGVAFASDTGTGWTCGAVGQVVTCTYGPTLAPAAATGLGIAVTVTAPAVPSVSDTVRVAAGGDVNAANNVAGATTGVNGVVDLALAKSHVGTFTVGQAGVYTLVVSNVGSTATTGAITIADTLPVGLSYTSVAGAGWSCVAVGQAVSCTDAGQIAAGAQSTVTLTVGVAAAAIPAVTNTASVSTPGDVNAANNKSTDVPTVVNGVVDLAVTATTPAFTVGQAGVYTIGVSNVGSVATTAAVTLVDTLPVGLSFTSAAGAGWTCAAVAQVVTCTNAGPIAAGASAPLTLTVGVAAGAVPSVTDTVRVATVGDVNAANNLAAVTTTVNGVVDLALAKSHTGAFVVGQTGIYTLVVSNVGSAATTGAITVADTLPAGLSFASVAGAGWSCAAVGQAVSCSDAGPIAAGAQSTVTLTVGVAAAAIPSVINTASVSTPGDNNAANNKSTDVPTIVDGVIDLAMTATTPAGFTVGQPGTYTLNVSNVGSAATSAPISIVDTLPGGLSFTSSAGAGWTCAAVGQVVTCTNPGPIAAGAADPVTLTVAVAAGAVPSVTDTVRVATVGDVNAANNVAAVTTGVNGVVDLAVSVTTPANFTVGQPGTYTISVSNVGSAATTAAITVVDTLPVGLSYSSAAGAGWSCAAVAQVVTCTNAGPIAAGASDPLALTVAVAAGAVPSVTDTVRVATAGEVNVANNTAAATTTVNGVVDLALAKSHTGSFTVGQPGVYTLVVSNVGSAATTGAITIADTLPAGLSYASVAGAGWTCTAVAQVVTCADAGPIAAGAQSTVTLTVGVAAAAIPSVINTASVSTPGDNNAGNNKATDVPTTVNGVIDLAVTATTPASFTVGQPGTYTLNVSNVGSAATTGAVTVTDTLPTGLSYTSVAGAGWTCAAVAQVVTCTNAGPIAAGAADPLTLTVGVAAGAVPSVTDTVRVATIGDGNVANNTAAVTTPVTGIVDLALAKTHAGTFTVGSAVSYTLTVSNVGSGPSTGTITLTDTLPAGVAYTGATGAGWSCVPAAQVVTCTSTGPIAPGATSAATLAVLLGTAAQPSVTNTAYVATPGDPNAANNKSVDGPVTVTVGVDLALTKSHTGAFTVGKPGAYTLTIANNGPGATTGPVTLTDSLPAGLTYTSFAGAGWTCAVVGQVVSCRYTPVLADAANAVLTLTVGVGAAAYPSVTNTARISTPGDTAHGGNNYAVDAPTAVTATSTLIVDKTASAQRVDLADALDYTIDVHAVGVAPVANVTVTDNLPSGFAYQRGSARVNGARIADPTGGTGPRLLFAIGTVPANATVALSYRVRVGPAGVHIGPAINTAQATSPAGGAPSNLASVTVQVDGGVFTNNGTIIGKVYVDCGCNGDGVQGPGDLGIPGVRVFLEDGTSAITDAEGKYSFSDITPYMHVVKVDRSTLPDGAKLVATSTRNAGNGYSRFVDLTNGELIKADFVEASGSPDVLAEVKARRAKGEPKIALALAFAGSPPATASPTMSLYTPSMPSLGGGFTTANAVGPSTTTPSAIGTGAGVGAMPSAAPAQAITVAAPESGNEWRTPFASVPLTPATSNLPTSLGGSDSSVFTITNPGPVAGLRGSIVGAAPAPTPRPLVVDGLIQAHLDLQSLTAGPLAGGRPDDGFMQSLRDISASGGDLMATARAAIFMRGTIRGGYLLTLGYDSEHANAAGLFRDIAADPLFPVAGDASVTGFDAQSAQRFYARIDKDRSYLLYGDFLTPSGTDVRQLSAYNRAMTGVLDHTEGKWGAADAFVSETRQHQVVDEFPAEGISGPYTLSQGPNLAANSETVELLIRDRNQPSIILSTTTEVRFVDYTIDPLSGRLLFRAPVPSLDQNMNPISIHVTYELSAAGKSYWSYGADAQAHIVKGVSVGGSYARDQDPVSPLTLEGVNASVALNAHTVFVAEYAHSDTGAGISGGAERIEVRHTGGRLQFRAFAEHSDSTFGNPSSTFGSGQTDGGAHATYTIDGRDRVIADAIYVENQLTGGTRTGVSASFERQLNRMFRLDIGYRYGHETAASATAATITTEGEAPITPNTTNAITSRLTATLSRTASIYGEYEQDIMQGADRRLAIGGDYVFLHKVRLYAEHEFITSLAGPYALNDAQQQNATVFGVDAAVSRDAQVFSEYRARDAFEGRQTENAIGLRNKWTLAPGIIANTSIERVDPIGGNASQTQATAVTGAIEYLANPLWRGTARLETRFTPAGDDFLGSLGYARKINADLTVLGRSLIDKEPQSLWRTQTQLGLALRPAATNKWNMLASVEQIYQQQADTGTGFDRHTAEILAAALSVQPTRRLMISARYAGKVDLDAANGTTTMTTGNLFTTRAVIDLSRVWDAGVIGSVLVGNSIASRQYGTGVEIGRVVVQNLRMAVGYNILGFSDKELSASNYTTRGFYLDMSFKFDESAFGWLASPSTPATASSASASASGIGAHR